MVFIAANDGSAAQTKTHKVTKGESLSSVSRRYKVKLSALAAANGLKVSAGLRIGQSLVIPGVGGGDSVADSLSPSVQRAIDRAGVKRGRWKRIVLHHSGTDEGTAKGMDNYHRRVRHMENGLAYHFVIGNGHGMKDGEIYVGERWTEQLDGGHLHSLKQNEVSLGICLVGNFDKTRPTAAQLRSLKALLSRLQVRCKLADSSITTHREINVVGTRCPGRNFPTEVLEKELAALSP